MTAIYFPWRLTIFNMDAPVLSTFFFLSEFIGFLLALCTIFLSWGMTARKAGAVPQGASVDVFVPTFREPVDVIRRTLEAAVAITYPHRTVVLDDGRRPEIQELAQSLGCVYLSRPQNIGAKAGNLNFGLSKSTSEFVMVFDADHIAQPNAIDGLLGYFDDPRVGLAQAPQDFYNLSAIQFVNAPNGALWHDQSYFYSIILPNADRFDGAICVGTSVIYRRSALDAIGGVPQDTVTEDLHTSLKMHKAGLATAYHPEPLAYGVGESILSDFYKVRLRWGHGNIHALRHENILFCRGLSLRQRLNYLLVGLGYLEGWQYLILYLIPVYSLLTGDPPFEITYANLAIIIAFPLASYILVQEFACGLGRFWVNEIFSMIRFPVALQASLAVVRNRIAWRPSSKLVDGRVEWAMMSPQLLVVGLSLAAILFAVSRVWEDPKLGGMLEVFTGSKEISSINWTSEFAAGYSIDLLLVAGFWAVLNIVRGILFVRKVVHSARNTHTDHRFHVPLILELPTTELGTQSVEVSQISLSFLQLKSGDYGGIQTGQITGQLYIPGETLTVALTSSLEGVGKFELSFASDKERNALESVLYSVEWHRNLFHSDAEFMTPLRYLARLTGLGKPNEVPVNWRPELVLSSDGKKELCYRNHGSKQPEGLLRFDVSGVGKPLPVPSALNLKASAS
ncbi:glycosyltransferase [Pseudophaeobacter sp.]|uniref:glycosyltransferase n=1 Tax=Pseudophaeobacter sp. TaxID=1971739 RepID=UPI003297F894